MWWSIDAKVRLHTHYAPRHDDGSLLEPEKLDKEPDDLSRANFSAATARARDWELMPRRCEGVACSSMCLVAASESPVRHALCKSPSRWRMRDRVAPRCTVDGLTHAAPASALTLAALSRVAAASAASAAVL